MRNQKSSALGKLILTIAFLTALCSPTKAQVIQKALLPGVNRLLSQQPTVVGTTLQWNLSLPAQATAVVVDVESTVLSNSFNYTVSFGSQAVDNPNVVPFSAAGPALTCYRQTYNLTAAANPPVIQISYTNFIAGIFAQQFVCPVPPTGHLALTFTCTAGPGSIFSLYTNVLIGPMPFLALPYMDTTGGVGTGGNRFALINSNTTTLLSTGGRNAVLLSIQVNNPGSGWTFSVCDTSGGGCTLGSGSVANSSALTGQTTFIYNAQMNNGLVITTGGTTPGDLTVSWRN